MSPNRIDADGLQVKTYTEIEEEYMMQFRYNYGQDINLDPPSPDRQQISITAQSDVDNLENLVKVYNSFSVESCGGINLDQRVALNGLVRRAGSFTETDIIITTDRALNLKGLDDDYNNINGVGYTVTDGSGNQFILKNSVSITGAGDWTLRFRARNIGKVLTIQNTITNPVTILLGVLKINNPQPAVIIGVDEESDVQLKVRRLKSFALQSVGLTDSLRAAILTLENVKDCYIAENESDEAIPDLPAKGIGIVVDGGADIDIAQCIYGKKVLGAVMVGEKSYNIERPNGTFYTCQWITAVPQNLYIQAVVNSRLGKSADLEYLKEQLIKTLFYGINQPALVADITVSINSIDNTIALSDVGVSLNGTDYFQTVFPTKFWNKFILDKANIKFT